MSLDAMPAAHQGECNKVTCRYLYAMGFVEYHAVVAAAHAPMVINQCPRGWQL